MPSPPLAPCFKTRLRIGSRSTWTSGPDVIVKPGQGPYTAARECLKYAAEQNPLLWIGSRAEVQAVDIDLIGTDTPTDLDWDGYFLTARQTITVSDA